MEEKAKQNSDFYLIIGIAIYLVGFLFLYLTGNNYTGVMSFLAPASIIFGALIIVIGLLF
jgi:hypothetical protein